MQDRFRKVVTAVAISLVAMSTMPGAPALAQDRYNRDRDDRDDRDRDRDRDDRDRSDRGGPGESVEIESFYEALEPHGRWFQHAQYGYVWSPDVDRNWRPYTRGKWQFTEEHGWYWQAEEPWGWAVFHYGRWFLDDDSGWVWVPGTEWAPAWVAWRHSDETVGWAPLPPEAEWRGSGLSFSESYYDSPRFNVAWAFAPLAVLGGYSVYRYLHPASRNYSYINRTRWVQSHSFVNRRIYNAGFDRGRYQQVTGRQITPLRIVAAGAPTRHGWGGAPRGEVHIYRPNVSRSAISTPPPRIGDQPQRDWRHGRPGVPNQPFQRPSWGGAPTQQQQPAAQQPGGFQRQGQQPAAQQPATQQQQQPAPSWNRQGQQRPPIAPTPPAQQPAAQQPATQQQAPSWNRQGKPPIGQIPPVQQAPVQQAPVQQAPVQAPVTRSAPVQAPVQAPAAVKPPPPPPAPPPVARQAPPPPPPAPPPVVRQAAPPPPPAPPPVARQEQQRPQGAGGGGGRPQGAPPPGQGQGKGDGKGDWKDRKKQEPPKQQ